MSDLIWLSEAQMRRIKPYFPLSHGVPRVDDRRVVSGIIWCYNCKTRSFTAACIVSSATCARTRNSAVAPVRG